MTELDTLRTMDHMARIAESMRRGWGAMTDSEAGECPECGAPWDGDRKRCTANCQTIDADRMEYERDRDDALREDAWDARIEHMRDGDA